MSPIVFYCSTVEVPNDSIQPPHSYLVVVWQEYFCDKARSAYLILYLFGLQRLCLRAAATIVTCQKLVGPIKDGNKWWLNKMEINLFLLVVINKCHY